MITATNVYFFVFTACRPGFYKAFAGNTKCSKCPPHSLTYVEATSICQCEKGYFRAEKDPPSMACTSKSVYFHLDILFLRFLDYLNIVYVIIHRIYVNTSMLFAFGENKGEIVLIKVVNPLWVMNVFITQKPH